MPAASISPERGADPPGRLRIAVDGDGLRRPRAGVGVYTRQLVGALAATTPAAVTVYAPPDAALPEGVIHAGRPRTPLLGRHLLWPAALRRAGFDAFLGCTGQLPLAGPGMPSVVTAHDLAIYRHPEWFPEGQWLSVRQVVPRSLRQATRVVCVSASTAADVEQLFEVPASRLRVVPLGVDPRFRPQPPEIVAETRRRLGLPERFVLFLSTLEPRKNLPVLVDAWSHLRDRPPLVVGGGTGWRADEIEAKLDRAGTGVVRLGGVDHADLPALYAAATCLCHPAWYEGFGLPPLEAMAVGTPVLASNRSSVPEVVGDAGLLLDPADPDAWTAALERVLGDAGLRDDLRARGLARAAAFTWERTAAGTWQAIEEAVSAG